MCTSVGTSVCISTDRMYVLPIVGRENECTVYLNCGKNLYKTDQLSVRWYHSLSSVFQVPFSGITHTDL